MEEVVYQVKAQVLSKDMVEMETDTHLRHLMADTLIKKKRLGQLEILLKILVGQCQGLDLWQLLVLAMSAGGRLHLLTRQHFQAKNPLDTVAVLIITHRLVDTQGLKISSEIPLQNGDQELTRQCPVLDQRHSSNSSNLSYKKFKLSINQ